MGLRVAAVLTAVVIVIAFIAAFLSSHHALTGSVPAGQDPTVKAYQAMLKTDYYAMDASTSNSCITIDDAGCEAAVNKVVPTLQHWASDLGSFRTPTAFVMLDGRLRHHLDEGIVELRAAVAFQKANNPAGFDLAMNAVNYERAWIDPATFTLEGTYSRVAGSYQDAVGLARQALEACLSGRPAPGDLGCSQLSQQQTCVSAPPLTCESYVQAAETQLQTFLVALTQNPAPGSLSAKDAKARAALARADTALLAITDALLKGDGAKAGDAERVYSNAVSDAGAALSDIAAV